MDREPKLARRFFDRYEPVHAVTYFAPEARAAFDGLGFRGFWMGYFAARSAPFGRVPPLMVTATFYNFSPDRVDKALPAAWEVASPEAALRARQRSAVAALRRYGLTDDENLRTAGGVAAKGGRRAPPRSTAGPCSRPIWRCHGRTNRSPRFGTQLPCCANNAATVMSRRWPHPVSAAGNATCCTPPRAESRGR